MASTNAATAAGPSTGARPVPRPLAWRRLRVVLLASLLLSLLLSPTWEASWGALYGRMVFVGIVQLLVFGLFERWPARLPRWLARWGLQVAAVALVVPFAVALAYTLSTFGDAVPWPRDPKRLSGFGLITGIGMLVTPWIAMSALYRQVSGQAQRQALAFELERSEHRRQALDARLQRLQAQVEPHFLFNTLANVRELVDSGSPQASAVLGHLIAYLRAAVPRLGESSATIAQEVELARAYLEVMKMRMPDRLQFTLHADPSTLALRCPQMTLLTLVENAVRHGIDPAEDGGRIDVRVRLRGDACEVEVADTGIGLPPEGDRGTADAGDGMLADGDADSGRTGTGLANLRERLRLAYGDAAHLWLTPLLPRGACAGLAFPAHGDVR